MDKEASKEKKNTNPGLRKWLGAQDTGRTCSDTHYKVRDLFCGSQKVEQVLQTWLVHNGECWKL